MHVYICTMYVYILYECIGIYEVMQNLYHQQNDGFRLICKDCQMALVASLLRIHGNTHIGGGFSKKEVGVTIIGVDLELN